MNSYNKLLIDNLNEFDMTDKTECVLYSEVLNEYMEEKRADEELQRREELEKLKIKIKSWIFLFDLKEKLDEVDVRLKHITTSKRISHYNNEEKEILSSYMNADAELKHNTVFEFTEKELTQLPEDFAKKYIQHNKAEKPMPIPQEDNYIKMLTEVKDKEDLTDVNPVRNVIISIMLIILLGLFIGYGICFKKHLNLKNSDTRSSKDSSYYDTSKKINYVTSLKINGQTTYYNSENEEILIQ